MRTLRILLRHELRSLLLSPSTYIAGTLFLFVLGLVYQAILDTYVADPQEDPPAVALFSVFWLPVFFMVPLLTMRSIAEERRLGTLETLLTAPVTPASVVLAKFLAAYLLYTGLWAVTALHPLLAQGFAAGAPLHDWGAIAAGYTFIASSGLLFIAIGILASALSRAQVVAAVGCFVGLFTLLAGGRYATDWLVDLGEGNRALVRLLRHIQPFEHAEAFARGRIDLGAIVFYVAAAAALLHIAALAVEVRSVRR